ncbi:MAG: FliM/FliN family flagellar motor C-terminal domain-containing protein [Phycisphaerales bacterium]|nr:FliM/FliN family flagellar motor switch protein [Planctomycetota bacterium]MCH8508507.1 FliM/FliN family flagellar motor C-terminal domain-containing protein [Phycisphaerales bacterium]
MTTEIDTILRLEVPLVVVLGERVMRVRDVRDFVPGTIIELAKSAEEDLEIRINNRPIGNGRAVKIGENFGVRVGYVGDPAARIQAMGPAAESGSEDNDGMSPEDLAEALLSGQ